MQDDDGSIYICGAGWRYRTGTRTAHFLKSGVMIPYNTIGEGLCGVLLGGVSDFAPIAKKKCKKCEAAICRGHPDAVGLFAVTHILNEVFGSKRHIKKRRTIRKLEGP